MSEAVTVVKWHVMEATIVCLLQRNAWSCFIYTMYIEMVTDYNACKMKVSFI